MPLATTAQTTAFHDIARHKHERGAGGAGYGKVPPQHQADDAEHVED